MEGMMQRLTDSRLLGDQVDGRPVERLTLLDQILELLLAADLPLVDGEVVHVDLLKVRVDERRVHRRVQLRLSGCPLPDVRREAVHEDVPLRPVERLP